MIETNVQNIIEFTFIFSSDEDRSKTFSVILQLSDGFDTVIGGTCNVFKPEIKYKIQL